MAKINHPFIIPLRYAFQTTDTLYMVLDYFNGGELFFHLKKEGRFSEERSRFYAAQITLALEELHRHNIIYRVCSVNYGKRGIMRVHDAMKFFIGQVEPVVKEL